MVHVLDQLRDCSMLRKQNFHLCLDIMDSMPYFLGFFQHRTHIDNIIFVEMYILFKNTLYYFILLLLLLL